MRRREFIMLLGSALAWPVTARAQHAGKKWRIAFITHVPSITYDEPLFDDLRELGYVEGQNIIIERRYAEGRPERFQEFAAEMVRLKADLIITTTTPAALAAKNATMTIPIVIPTAIDPVGTGLIANLAHPGGNITGGAILTGEMAAKRLELLKEVVPSLSRTAAVEQRQSGERTRLERDARCRQCPWSGPSIARSERSKGFRGRFCKNDPRAS